MSLPPNDDDSYIPAKDGVLADQGEDSNGTTWLFALVRGESPEQIEAKRKAGYTEHTNFVIVANAYCCFSCEYFEIYKESPTGFRCSKYGFFDRPNGCSDGWELKPQLRQYKDATDQ